MSSGQLSRREFLSLLGLAGLGTLSAQGSKAKSSGSFLQIELDYQSPLHQIPKTIYGHFIEELGKCIEGGIWRPEPGKDQFLGGIDWELIQAIQLIQPAVIRFPGGCFADSYHWQDGIGPRQKRKPKPNPAWGRYGKLFGPTVSNQFGTDEFIAFCRQVGAEPMLTVNLGSGTPEEACAWVEYCNGSADSKWGSLRAKYGHPEPYRVKYWCVGNESWNPLDGKFSAEEYARRYLEFARAMRKVDSEIRLIAVGWTEPGNNWNRTVLETVGREVDYLSIHSYYPLIPVVGDLMKYTSYKPLIEGALSRFSRDLNKGLTALENWAPPEKELKISFDEWNLWFSPWELYQTNYNLRDGLVISAMLCRLQELAEKVELACLAQLVNTIGIIISDQRGTFLTPSAWAFHLFTRYGSSRYLKPKIKPGNNLPVVASANKNPENGSLSIFLVNLARSRSFQSEILIKNFAPKNPPEIALLWHKNPMKYNSFKNPEAVVPRIIKENISLKKSSQGISFSVNLPEHSLVVISWKGSRG